MKLKLSQNVKEQWIVGYRYFSFQSINKFISYLFPDILKIDIVENDYDCVLYGIFYKKEDIILQTNKINILLCVENCNVHKNFYPHYDKFGDYGNQNISIYFYNHINRCVLTKDYISIPIIYTQIDYFNRYYEVHKPANFVPFKEKSFCIILTSYNLRGDIKRQIVNKLNEYGKCDLINMYANQISNKSCYHSIDFLNVIQRYKFAFVCENSVTDGYITEKIFNCFFARTIPIYNGSHKIEYYFNNKSFINANDIINLDKIKHLINNEESFSEMINTNKINPYDDEDYKKKLKNFIENKIATNNF